MQNSCYDLINFDFILSTNNIQDITKNNTTNIIIFIGKSNVGKSSLINYITKQSKLTKTSKNPGTTLNINLFSGLIKKKQAKSIKPLIKKILLMDFPGYGYAKTNKKHQEMLLFLIKKHILLHKNNINYIFHLMDIRHSPNKEVIRINNIVNSSNKSIIFTKIDKLKKHQQLYKIRQLKSCLNINNKKIIGASSKANIGRLNILKIIWKNTIL